MTEANKISVKAGEEAGAPQARRPFESLRREVDRLFDEVGTDFWRTPFRRSAGAAPIFRTSRTVGDAPAVDIVEKDNAYEMTADVPGFEEGNIQVELLSRSLWIKGERRSEKEERRKDYHLSEREFGSFQRCFSLPEDVDTDRIEANLSKGVLTVTLPKLADAQKAARSIEVKPGS
jgi:HSP20 family protein